MKIARFLSLLVLITLAVTVVVPAPVYAYSSLPDNSEVTISLANAKTGTLTVNNVGGGTLRVYLSGPRSYYFSTSKNGKSKFTGIELGEYTITLRSTACAETVTVTRKINGSVTLKDTVCKNTKESTNKDKDSNKKGKTASLIVNNKTGGSLYITLSGPRTYYFYTASKGNTTFSNIEPGRYEITVRSSACYGTLTYSKNFKDKVKLPTFVCR